MRAILLLLLLVVSSCGPNEPIDLEPTNKVDSSYVFTNKNKRIMEEEKEIQEILELEGNIQADESSAFSTEPLYGPQYTCPNCGELFDGHECENCHYTEER